MHEYLRQIIHLALDGLGLSKNKLVEELGEHNISRKTLQRLDNGGAISLESFRTLFEHFKIKMPYEPKDAYEEQLLKESIYVSDRDETSSISDIQDCIERYNCEIKLYRQFCKNNLELSSDTHINNMIELFLFLPIIPQNALNTAFLRMGGEFRGRLAYFLDQLENLYRSIPESQLKSDVDELAKEMSDPRYVASSEARKRYTDFLNEKAQVEFDLNYDLQKYSKMKKKVQPDTSDPPTECGKGAGK